MTAIRAPGVNIARCYLGAMLWTLLACRPEVPAPESDPIQAEMPPGHAPADATADAREMRAFPMPEPPFTARTRLVPTTLVDKHGSPLLVLDQVGVEVEVHNLLVDRAWVTCTGCRAPLDAWIQRQGLHVGTNVGDGPQDPLLAFVAAQEELPAVSAKGFVEVDGVWTAPPWHDEGGYDGEVLRIASADGFEVLP